MTLSEIKAAVQAGKAVHWKNEAYRVTCDSKGQWHIACGNGSLIGLTWADDVTLNGKECDFYVAE